MSRALINKLEEVNENLQLEVDRLNKENVALIAERDALLARIDGRIRVHANANDDGVNI